MTLSSHTSLMIISLLQKTLPSSILTLLFCRRFKSSYIADAFCHLYQYHFSSSLLSCYTYCTYSIYLPVYLKHSPAFLEQTSVRLHHIITFLNSLSPSLCSSNSVNASIRFMLYFFVFTFHLVTLTFISFYLVVNLQYSPKATWVLLQCKF